MNATAYTLILIGVVLNACAQLMLKAGANRIGEVEIHLHNIVLAGKALAFSAPIIGGIACYALSVVVWILALTRVEVSVAYPMLSIGYVVNAFAAWALFGETLTAMRLTGIVVIVLGVWMVASSGRGL
jgi:multidrug transporter EmrE-like cation transporter